MKERLKDAGREEVANGGRVEKKKVGASLAQPRDGTNRASGTLMHQRHVSYGMSFSPVVPPSCTTATVWNKEKKKKEQDPLLTDDQS